MIKLRAGHLSTLYHTSILMMAGDFIENDPDMVIEWKLFGTGPAIVDAFKKKEIDLAYIGLPPAIIGIDKGVQIICTAGGHIEGTVIAGRPEFRGFPEVDSLEDILRQFRGLKIGIPGRGSIHDVIIQDYLEKYELNREVEVVNFQWADQVLEAIHRRDVSVAVGTPALAAAVRRYTGGTILFPPSKLWPNNPSYGIVVHREYLGKKHEIIEKFLLFHERATDFLRNKPSEAANVISEFIGIADADFVMETLKISPRYCAQITDAYISSTLAFVNTLKRLGYINHNISEEEIFDTSLIRKIHPLEDHYRDGLNPGC